jgi:hypothetical protein
MYGLAMGSSGLSWNFFALIDQIEDFDFLVIFLPWGKLLPGFQEEK